MGQAKKRGTFAQRQSLAIERDKEVARLRAEQEAARPKRNVSVKTLALLGLIAGMNQR